MGAMYFDKKMKVNHTDNFTISGQSVYKQSLTIDDLFM